MIVIFATSQHRSGKTFVYITNSHCRYTFKSTELTVATWGLRPCLFHIVHCVESNKFTELLTAHPFGSLVCQCLGQETESLVQWASSSWVLTFGVTQSGVQSVTCLPIDQWALWSIILAHTFYIIRNSPFLAVHWLWKLCKVCLYSPEALLTIVGEHMWLNIFKDNITESCISGTSGF